MQVGKILLRARWAIQRLKIRNQLNQITGNESGRQAKLSQHLHQQPGTVAAGALLQCQRLLAALHARLHANGVLNLLLQQLVQIDEEIDSMAFRAVDSFQQLAQPRSGSFALEKRQQVLGQHWFVFEGEKVGAWLDEEVERIDDCHVGDQIDGNAQLANLLGKNDPGLKVAVRVLLPIDEVVGRLDLERVTQDRCPTMRCRPQPHHLRPQRGRSFVAIVSLMIECDANCHAGILCNDDCVK